MEHHDAKHNPHFSRDGVDQLMKLITCIKDRGWNHSFSDDVMYGQDNSGNPYLYSEPLLSLRRCLEDSKVCLEALNTVKAHLARKIRRLQRRSTPLVLEDGIKRLPDELLAQIFEAGFQTTEYSKFSLRVSHVSRRFRDISLRTPLLWTRISLEYGHHQTHAFLSRSGDIEIHIETSNPNVPKWHVEPFLRILAPYSSRWSRLILSDEETETILQDLGLIHLPRLRYLYHCCEVNLSTFNMPMLSHIEGEGACLPPGLPFRSQLTCMVLSFHDVDSPDIAALTRTLYQLASLRDLSLEFINCELPDDVTALDVAEIPKPHSVLIESLSVTIRDSTSREFVMALYEALSYLKASTVDISLQMDQRGLHPHGFIFASKIGPFPYGSTIRLHIPRPCDIFYILENIAWQCDIVHSVQFEVSTVNVKENYDFRKIAFLRHLHFRNCDTLCETVVERLVKNLPLLNLEITTCKKISEEFLLNLGDQVGEKLKWTI